MEMFNQRVFLTGIMGVGKSYWAKALSAHLNIPSFDTDAMIEASTGETIAAIFSGEGGENRFRQLEHALLKETEWPEPAIISCGGGLPCFFNNMELLLEKGIVVWLNPTTEIIVQRLVDGKNHRPLVASEQSKEAIRERIDKLLTARKPFYSKAHLWVTGEDSVDDLVKSLIRFKSIKNEHL